MNTITMAEAVSRLAELVDDVAAHGTVYLIRSEDTPAAVLTSVEEYESLHETLAVLSDRSTMDRLRASLDELDRGEVASVDEVFPDDG